MLEALKTKTLLTTAGLLTEAVGLGLSPMDTSGVALAVGGLMIKRVRAYVRRGYAQTTRRPTAIGRR